MDYVLRSVSEDAIRVEYVNCFLDFDGGSRNGSGSRYDLDPRTCSREGVTQSYRNGTLRVTSSGDADMDVTGTFTDSRSGFCASGSFTLTFSGRRR